MNGQRIGIVASVSIHAGFFLLLIVFWRTVPPPVQTFTITLEDRKAILTPVSPGRAKTTTPATPKEQVRSAPPQPHPSAKMDTPILARAPDPSAKPGPPAAAVTASPVKASVPAAPAVSKTAERSGRSSGADPGGKGKDVPVETAFGNADAPKFIHRQMPVYPKWARREGIEGKVVLKLFIDQAGKLLDVSVIEAGGHGFTESAVEAVRKSSFAPATRNGVNVASKAILPIRFSLK